MGQTRTKKTKKSSQVSSVVTEILGPEESYGLKFDGSKNSTRAGASPVSYLSSLQVSSGDDSKQSEPDAAEPCIEVRSTPDRGKGVFATRKIPTGALVFHEHPLIRLTRTEENHDKSAVDSSSLSLLDHRFRTLPKPAQRTYLALHDSEKSGFTRVKSIYYSNCYNLSGRNRPSRSSAGGSCIGALASRVNHSCVPNVQFSYNEERDLMVFRALKPIGRGKEVLSNYDSVFEMRVNRQRKQTMYYGFACACEACEVPSRNEFWSKSDERRKAMVEARRDVIECEERYANTRQQGGEERFSNYGDPSLALERLEGLLMKEGLVGLPLADTYRSLGKWAERKEDLEGVMRWRVKELGICGSCLGTESVRVRELKAKLKTVPNEEEGKVG